jgi:hypothetical protein
MKGFKAFFVQRRKIEEGGSAVPEGAARPQRVAEMSPPIRNGRGV